MPIDPLTLTSVVAPMALQTGLGIYQQAKGARMAAQAERPEYEIPQEIYENLSQSELMALEGLPAEQKKEFVDNIQRGIQAGMRGLKDRSAGLAGIGGLVQQQMDQYRNMFSQDAAQRINNIATLQNNRNTMATYRDKEFKTNELDPYMNQVAAAEAMKGAGLQNIMGGVSAGSNTYLDYIKYQQFLNANTPVTQDTTQQTTVAQNRPSGNYYDYVQPLEPEPEPITTDNVLPPTPGYTSPFNW